MSSIILCHITCNEHHSCISDYSNVAHIDQRLICNRMVCQFTMYTAKLTFIILLYNNSKLSRGAELDRWVVCHQIFV